MWRLQYPTHGILGGITGWVFIPNEQFKTSQEARKRAGELYHQYPFPIVVVFVEEE